MHLHHCCIVKKGVMVGGGVMFYYSIAKFVVVELLLRFVAAFGQRGYGNAAATIVNCRLLPLSLMRCLRRHRHTIHLIYVCTYVC